jgi:hypothetical protein
VNRRSTTILKVVFFLGACTAMTAFWTVVLLVTLHRPSRRVLASWPSSVRAEPAEPRLSVVEADWDFSGFPLELQRNVEIYVGRGAGNGSYGHYMRYSFHPSGDDYRALGRHLHKCTVTWAPEGVTLSEPDGHRLFIPAASYLGGR